MISLRASVEDVISWSEAVTSSVAAACESATKLYSDISDSMCSTASLICNIISDICFPESLLSWDNFFISFAMTLKPLPASLALAASIAAFKANKLDWDAIFCIETSLDKNTMR